MIPNIEKIVCDYLRDAGRCPDIAALNAKIVQQPPAKKLDPWVEVYQLDDRDETNAKPEWLLSFMLQFDCYAGQGRDADGQGPGVPGVVALNAAVRAALKALEDTIEQGVVIKWVKLMGGPRIHDEAMPRKILTATVWVHPGS